MFEYSAEVHRIERVGYLKGKNAVAIARQFSGRQRNFTGEVLGARGYFVSNVGLDEAMIRVRQSTIMLHLIPTYTTATY